MPRDQIPDFIFTHPGITRGPGLTDQRRNSFQQPSKHDGLYASPEVLMTGIRAKMFLGNDNGARAGDELDDDDGTARY